MKKYESLKKVDLHCHLEGSLNPVRVIRWTRKEVGEVENSLMLKAVGDMEDFKEVGNYANSLLQTKARLKEAAIELCKDLKLDNVIYAEIRLDPVAHTEKGLTLKEVVDSTLEGMAVSTLKTKLILMVKRNYDFETNKSVVDLAKKYLKKGVCAIDLGGPETACTIRSMKELFEYATSNGVPFVMHAGEKEDYKGIDAALSFGAKRIGHGLSAIKHYDTMEKLKKLDVPLDICLTANIATGIFENYSDHPIERLMDSGVAITINTDNRTINKTTLTDEYILLNKHFGFTIKDFNEMNKMAIEHSFLSDKEKQELLKELV